MLSQLPDAAAKPLEALLSPLLSTAKESLYVTKSVREMLFEGYSDPIISLLTAYIPKTLAEKLSIPKRIGLFYGVSSVISLCNEC